ncbi:hypothetical protein [Polymorphospora rubra]|uniref:hypothetical protein n=1 Tax=Polymorphospora rubra TaxID=338584 RepID=UPI001BB313D4|nr:hypothetical protein [Polymorphospora rubra]
MVRTVAQKMGVRPGCRAHLLGAPAESVAALELPKLELVNELDGPFDYLHLFVVTQAGMRRDFPTLREHLRPGGMLWVSWPKGGRHGTDLTMRSVIAIGYDLGMVESVCLRVDDKWAGLKFTHPKPGKTYHNSFGTLRVDEREIGLRRPVPGDVPHS